MLGTRVEKRDLCGIASLLGCKVDEWPLKHLGLPLGGRPKSLSFWDLVVRGIKRSWLAGKYLFGRENKLD